MLERRIALACVCWFVAVAGCSSSASRIDAPQAAQTAASQDAPALESGPKKVQYSAPAAAKSSPQVTAGAALGAATPQSQDAAAAARATGSGKDENLGYRNTTVRPLPKMALTSAEERTLRNQRPTVDLFETYQRDLPWNSTGNVSPLTHTSTGLPKVPTFSTGIDRGRR